MKKHIFKALSMAVMSTSLLFSNTATATLTLSDGGSGYTNFTLSYPSGMSASNFNPLGTSDKVLCSNDLTITTCTRKFVFNGQAKGCPNSIDLNYKPIFKIPLISGQKPVISSVYKDVVTGSSSYTTSPTGAMMPPAELQSGTSASYTFFGLVSFGVAIDGVPFDPNTGNIYGLYRVSAFVPDSNTTPTPLCPSMDGILTQGTALSIGNITHQGCLGVDNNRSHVANAIDWSTSTGTRLHYHAMPWKFSPKSEHSPIIGYAADGYPIYGMYVYGKGGITNKTKIVQAKSGYAKLSARGTPTFTGTVTGTNADTNVKTISSKNLFIVNANATLVQTGTDKGNNALKMIMPNIKLRIPTWDGAGNPVSPTPSTLSNPVLGTFDQDYEYSYTSPDADGNFVLDPCNGTYNSTPEYPNGTYYYVITSTYPFVPRCFGGKPKIDSSFVDAN